MDRRDGPAADHLFRAVAKQGMTRRRHVAANAVESDPDDHVVRMIGEQPVASLALGNRGFAFLACGDIGEDARRADVSTVGVADCRNASLEPSPAIIGMTVSRLEYIGVGAVVELLPMRGDRREIVGVDQIGRSLPDRCFDVVTGYPRPARVEKRPAALGIGAEKHVACRLDDQPVFGGAGRQSGGELRAFGEDQRDGNDGEDRDGKIELQEQDLLGQRSVDARDRAIALDRKRNCDDQTCKHRRRGTANPQPKRGRYQHRENDEQKWDRVLRKDGGGECGSDERDRNRFPVRCAHR